MKLSKQSKRKSDVIDKHDTAFHEAAHTIVALYFGHEVGETTIVGNEREAGSSETKPTRSFHRDIPVNYFALEEEIVIYMVGKEAVVAYRRETGQRVEGVDFGDELDMEPARKYAGYLQDLFTDEDVEHCLKRLRQVAACVVIYGPIWGAIAALAGALLESDTVPADKARAVFKQAMGAETVRMPLIQSTAPAAMKTVAPSGCSVPPFPAPAAGQSAPPGACPA